MSNRIIDLLQEHTEILMGIEDYDKMNPDDPKLLKIEEIMKEIKKLQEDEAS